MLEISEINRSDQFYELEPKWNELLEKSKDKNPYLTWEYLSTCWKHFGNGKKLRILVVRHNNEENAIAPFKQSCYSFMGKLNYEVIEPLGYRCADYTGLLLAERERDCLKLVLEYLIEHGDWDFIYLYDVPGTSIVPELLPKKLDSNRLKLGLSVGAICPYIIIPESFDALFNDLRSKFRKNLRRGLRQLQEKHKVKFERYENFGSAEHAMKIFFKLHQERWKSRQMLGVFNTSKTCNFFTDVAKRFSEKGWLALYFLTVDGNPVAATYNHLYNQKMYFVLGGSDPDYDRYSVGHLLIQKTIEHCVLNKIREFDFLKGGESYKFDWTKTYRRNLRIRFVNRKKKMSRVYDFGIKTLKRTRVDKITGRFLKF